MISTPQESASQLAEIVAALVDRGALEDICRALETTSLTIRSGATTRASLAAGSSVIETKIAALQTLWAKTLHQLPGAGLSLVLHACAIGLAHSRKTPVAQPVWTGPSIDGSFLRTTREVVKEIVDAAQHQLLVIGYWIQAEGGRPGGVQEFIYALAAATTRGVAGVVVLDHRRRPDGADNLDIFRSLWPTQAPLPEFLTWRLPKADRHLKLHAKVLVADSRDALVTSANITRHAMDLNIEMGLRVRGPPADIIARHFELLAQRGVLGAYDQSTEVIDE